MEGIQWNCLARKKFAWHEPRLISSADLDGCEGSTARLEDVDFDDLAG